MHYSIAFYIVFLIQRFLVLVVKGFDKCSLHITKKQTDRFVNDKKKLKTKRVSTKVGFLFLTIISDG